jgi:hypothetical protein
MKIYADKLAEGLPDGMLPKDVEVLREANTGLAAELTAITEQRDDAREQVQQLNHQLARSQEDDDLLVIAWMHGAESNRRQCRDLARECDRLRDALRAIIGCGLNCKDSLDEAEQMERIAKEALSPENENSPPRGEKEA